MWPSQTPLNLGLGHSIQSHLYVYFFLQFELLEVELKFTGVAEIDWSALNGYVVGSGSPYVPPYRLERRPRHLAVNEQQTLIGS